MFKNMNFGLNFSNVKIYSKITTSGTYTKKGSKITPFYANTSNSLCFNDAGFLP